MLPGALLTAFWPPPPPSLASGGAGLALYVAVLILFGVYPPEGLTRYLTNQDCPDNHVEIHFIPHELPTRKKNLIFTRNALGVHPKKT